MCQQLVKLMLLGSTNQTSLVSTAKEVNGGMRDSSEPDWTTLTH